MSGSRPFSLEIIFFRILTRCFGSAPLVCLLIICIRYKANLLKRPRRGLEEETKQEEASSSDSDAPISRAGTTPHRHVQLLTCPQPLLLRRSQQQPPRRAPKPLRPA